MMTKALLQSVFNQTIIQTIIILFVFFAFRFYIFYKNASENNRRNIATISFQFFTFKIFNLTKYYFLITIAINLLNNIDIVNNASENIATNSFQFFTIYNLTNYILIIIAAKAITLIKNYKFAKYDNDNNTTSTLTNPTYGRNIATNSIHDQSNNLTSNENTRARPIHLSTSIIPNHENYNNNDNTQSQYLDDIDELGLGENFELRDINFSST